MTLRTKLENGGVVKTDADDGSEPDAKKMVSQLEGDTLHIHKWGNRSTKDAQGNVISTELCGATATATVITRDQIDETLNLCPVIGAFGAEQVCLEFNQVQREDAINRCNAEIRGDGIDPATSKAKRVVGIIKKADTVEEAQGYVQLAEDSGYGDQLRALLGDDEYDKIKNA